MEFLRPEEIGMNAKIMLFQAQGALAESSHAPR